METKEKLKKILTEWSDFRAPALYRRDFNYSLLKGDEILSIIGGRRTGKTYLCYQIIEELKKTLPADNIAYINFEDERLYPLKGDELSLLWEVYLELFSVNLNKKIYLFVDEIQNVKNWSKWARRITEQQKNLKLIITGSSSKLLSKEIATELRGRARSFSVYPLSFREYLAAKNVPLEEKNILYSDRQSIIKRQFNDYLKTGGFPAVLSAPEPRELLKEYYKAMFYRDLIERYKVKNIKLFDDYLTLSIDQVASSFSISATGRKLKEFGHTFSKNTLANFSKYAQEAFLLFESKSYSYKVKEQLRLPKKIYAIDHGLVQAIRFSFSQDRGRMLENIAYLALKRKGSEIYYYRGSKECDFITVDNNKVTGAFQVTKSLTDDKTRKREIEGLLECLRQHKIKQGIILTEDEHDSLEINGFSVKVLPLWYWLLI